ncbi:hypothetical protein Syun_031071 [Stephania yunnanensis]|uniref:Uncharacterized protein n=1 Tax=Stephania yunnanensis TaxID=152371 RepID=A0AAP0HGF5_9MAGN
MCPKGTSLSISSSIHCSRLNSRNTRTSTLGAMNGNLSHAHKLACTRIDAPTTSCAPAKVTSLFQLRLNSRNTLLFSLLQSTSLRMSLFLSVSVVAFD